MGSGAPRRDHVCIAAGPSRATCLTSARTALDDVVFQRGGWWPARRPPLPRGDMTGGAHSDRPAARGRARLRKALRKKKKDAE